MLRRTVSLTSLLSFILMIATSIVLYFEPEGRVAYWADWHFLGMNKHQWGDTHVTLGVLFMVSAGLHIWLNWTPVVTYMKNKARQLVVITPPMVFATVITLFVFIGTLLHLPPMQQVVDLSAYFKDNMAEKYGNPPYGHAELSTLKKFCGHMGIDLSLALNNLREAGLETVSGNMTLQQIGRDAGINPSAVFALMRGKSADGTSKTGEKSSVTGGDPFSVLPASPPPGLGKQSLESVCKQYDLPLADALERLGAAGIAAGPDSTLKTLAADNDKQPVDIYHILRGTN